MVSDQDNSLMHDSDTTFCLQHLCLFQIFQYLGLSCTCHQYVDGISNYDASKYVFVLNNEKIYSVLFLASLYYQGGKIITNQWCPVFKTTYHGVSSV